MTDLLETARALGREMLETEEGRRFTMAKAVYATSPEAQRKFEEYRKYRETLQSQVDDGELSEDEVQEGIKRLTAMTDALSEEPVLRELSESEADFYELLNSAVDAIRQTVTGMPSGCGGNCGGCAGCGA